MTEATSHHGMLKDLESPVILVLGNDSLTNV